MELHMHLKTQAPGDGQLVARAKRDGEAFAELYLRHYDEIFRYCVHRTFSRTDAEDLTSEVFTRAVAGIGRFSGSDRAFRPWLFRIATNTANTHARKAAMSRWHLSETHELAGSLGDKSADDKPADDASAVMLKRAIKNLKPKHQAVIAMRFFEDRSVAEISELLGHSQATVRSQLSRAMAKLRSRLALAEETGRRQVK